MSASESSPKSSPFSPDTVKDICLWRRKKLSLVVVLVSTATWVLLDVCQFNFVTVASWAAMVVITVLFLYGNLVRLVYKEEPNLPGLEVSEETMLETANSVRELIEEGIRWMLQVSAQRDAFNKDAFTFVRVIAVLWLLSYLGSLFDFLTLIYIGMVLGMTGPIIYVKNEDKIKRRGEWMKMKSQRLYKIMEGKSRRFYEMMDEKVFKKMKNKVAKVTDAKEKKID